MEWILVSSAEDAVIREITAALIDADCFSNEQSPRVDSHYCVLYVAHGEDSSGIPHSLQESGRAGIMRSASAVVGLSCYSYFFLRSQGHSCYVGFARAPWYPQHIQEDVFKCWHDLFEEIGKSIASSEHVTDKLLNVLDGLYSKAIGRLDSLAPSIDSLLSAMVLADQRTSLAGECEVDGVRFGEAANQ